MGLHRELLDVGFHAVWHDFGGLVVTDSDTIIPTFRENFVHGRDHPDLMGFQDSSTLFVKLLSVMFVRIV